MNKPRDLALDSNGANLYIADTGNSAIRKIDLANEVGKKGQAMGFGVG